MLLLKGKIYFGEIGRIGTGEGVVNHRNDFFGYLSEKFNLISFVGKLVFA